MEPLWSPVVATDGNQRQIERPQERRKQGKTVAVGCDRLPEKFHGKEGVDAVWSNDRSTGKGLTIPRYDFARRAGECEGGVNDL
jgi:hypothetical protein